MSFTSTLTTHVRFVADKFVEARAVLADVAQQRHRFGDQPRGIDDDAGHVLHRRVEVAHVINVDRGRRRLHFVDRIVHRKDLARELLRFGLEKPVFRIVVNTFGTLGTTGYTTGVMPAMTLGSGGVGGAITGDNITVHHLYNVKKLAYETRVAPEAAFAPGSTDDPAQRRLFTGGSFSAGGSSTGVPGCTVPPIPCGSPQRWRC